jgi:hypothetical protein
MVSFASGTLEPWAKMRIPGADCFSPGWVISVLRKFQYPWKVTSKQDKRPVAGGQHIENAILGCPALCGARRLALQVQ